MTWMLMPWNEYRRLAVEEAKRDGFLVTAKRLRIGKTTLFRWARALETHRKRHITIDAETGREETAA